MKVIFISIILFVCFLSIYFYSHIDTYTHKLAIMAIFKNEEDYINDWIDYHIDQGINHFYLYCNDPNIQKYDFSKYQKFITLIDWTNKINNGSHTIQRQAYFDCVTKYSHYCKFIMMLDIDEFVVNKSNKKVIDYIDTLDNNTKAIKIQRFNFGSNGHVTKPTGKVYENYTMREKNCSSYKTIANTRFIDTSKMFFGVHDFNFLPKNGNILNSYFSYEYTGFPNGCNEYSVNETPLVIHHYYTKSYDEYLKRCDLWKNGGVNTIGYRKNCAEEFDNINNKINEILDKI